MLKSLQILGGLTLALGSVAVAGAQQAAPHLVDYCVKIQSGKGAEFSAFIRDVSSKMAQVDIDSGRIVSFSVGRAVVPAGTSARCDAHIYFGSAGFPPELESAEAVAAKMKKAGLTMSREEMLAKRQSLITLVSVNIWRGQAQVGTVKEGSYLRLNFYKTSDAGEWANLESHGWKGLVEEAAKDMPGLAWGAATLVMPEGASLPYNAATYDAYPTWEALGQGIPMRKYWNKAHPDTDVTAYLNRVADVIDRPMTDVIRMQIVLRK